MMPAETKLLHEGWLHQGLGEHASVAAFARFQLHLMQLGAPPRLLSAAARAMNDEIEHAKLCFGVAARFGPVASPGAFPVDNILGPVDPASILTAAIIEGCVNETIAAHCAAVALQRTQDREIREVLEIIVDDETRHAELSWDCVDWMLEKDESLLPVAREAFRVGISAPPSSAPDEPLSVEAYGHLTTQSRRQIRASITRELIEPRAAKLLARS